MARHRRLCERAVDPLEIAAGLEAHGITDRTAARYRHRDVFSLAEELHARVPGTGGDGPPGVRAGRRSRSDGARAVPRLRTLTRATGEVVLPLLPGTVCAAGLALPALLRRAPFARAGWGDTAAERVGLALLLAALAGLAAWPALRRAARAHSRTRTGLALPSALAAGWLAGCAAYAGAPRATPAHAGLLPPLTDDGRAVLLALACGLAPAVWCARWFAARARRGLDGSRSLADFAAGTRPLLAAAVLLFTGSLAALAAGARPAAAALAAPHTAGGPTAGAGALWAATLPLGVLLFAALLLYAHGFPRTAAAGLAATALAQTAVTVLGRPAGLPWPDAVARPVRAAVDACSPAAVPAAVCGCAALVLLGCAVRLLSGASAHRRAAPVPFRTTAGPGPSAGPAPRPPVRSWPVTGVRRGLAPSTRSKRR